MSRPGRGRPPASGRAEGIAARGPAQKWFGAKFTLARTIAGPHNARMASPKSKLAPTKPRTRFDAVETKDGQWLVRLTLPGGGQPEIDGFRTQAEARRWIKGQSAVWLKMYEGGKYA
jgi:hypothetical protein